MGSGREAGPPLWIDGELLLRVRGPAAGPSRIVKLRKPYAVIGRSPGVDIRLDDPGVSSRHAYLHLDRRGLFGVDLVSRAGTRFAGVEAHAAWLGPDQGIELAGHRIEILELRVDGRPIRPAPCPDDPLSSAADDGLDRVTLEPVVEGDPPWKIGSELVFLGRSPACGVTLAGGSAERAHCALIRTAVGAYLVDLIGRRTRLNRRPIRGAAPVLDGDLLAVGATEFRVRIGGRALVPELVEPEAAPQLGELAIAGETTIARVGPGGLPLPSGIDPDQAETLLAWMLGMFRAGQGELVRRQDAFQATMTEALEVARQENATTIEAHLARMAELDRELNALRSDLADLNRPAPAPSLRDALPTMRDSPPTRGPTPVESRASATWLLDRIGRLEDESRSSWRDLLARITPADRRPG